ncbi:hypothetical protein [Lyngbya aestuarii]|uniref:hypothetical protein n=1 Tax=Lyngbya aestuarii TaxID=118322 RepID=UPI00403D91B7
MFKSRRNPYRKRRRSLPFPVILLTIPLILIILELLAVFFVSVTGNKTKLAAYQGEPAKVTAYSLKFLSPQQKPYDGLPDRGLLAVQRSPVLGYRLVGDQQSDFWRIDTQGFREDDPVPLAKPNNEIRIFLLGGSAAFGQGSQSNQATIASFLENRLNKRVAQQRRSPEKYRPATLPFYKPDLAKALALPPRILDGEYRVINAAVPGYSSGNELAQLTLQIMPYSPDAVVVMDGYTDLMLPTEQAVTNIPYIDTFLNNAPRHFLTYLTQNFQDWLTNTNLVKALQYWILKPEPSVSKLSLVVTEKTGSLEQHLAADTTQLQRTIERYRDHHKQMISLMSGTGIPLVTALQPEITGRGTKQISPPEQEILKQLGAGYREKTSKNYAELAKASQQLQTWFPDNVKTLNFYRLYEDFPEQAFSDAIHLTEEANLLLSERFYQTLTTLPKLQVIAQQK